jgi:serine/threonine-protein kinase
MCGNVWEYVEDWFAVGYYADGQVNPRGPAGGAMHVSKGGSWTTDDPTCRASYRCTSLPGARWGYCGFRCAKSVIAKEDLQPSGRENMVEIPAGKFLMGSDGYLFGSPEHEIHLDAYLIDRTPVTNAGYLAFVRATRYPPPPHWRNGRPPQGWEEHPVTHVTLEDARAYAAWAGKELPTEAQWEKAARGTDGREYPWGEDYDETRCNTLHARIGRTVRVGSYPDGASPYGVLGMCGNVWEWVEGRWDPDWYEVMPERNPDGRSEEGLLVLRGGTWSTLPRNCRTWCRIQALRGTRWDYCGFRCVVN